MLEQQRFPDFLCIGAQKAGTSWLHKNLNKHPDIGLPPIKELQYFIAREQALKHSLPARLLNPELIGRHYRGSLKRWRKPAFTQLLKVQLAKGDIQGATRSVHDFLYFSNDDLYSAVFRLMPKKVVGEIAPEYGVLSDDSIRHIHTIMPDLKIIFIIRNPIDRVWSSTRMNLSRENREFSTFTDTDFIASFNQRASRKRSDYLEIIKNWQKYFPKERFLVCFFDDLAKNPQGFINNIYDFLGVDKTLESLKPISAKPDNSYATAYKDKLSTDLKKYLADMYYPQLKNLSNTFGHHATEWLRSADQILA